MKIIMMLSIFAICYLPLLVFMAFVPYLTRKTIVFGISVPEEVSNDTAILKLRRLYRNIILGFGIPLGIIVLAAFTGSGETVAFIVFIAGMFLLMGISAITYLKFHKQMQQLKEKSKWSKGKNQVLVVDTDFNKKKLLVSPLWFILHIVIIIATIIVGVLLYDKLPDRIPIKYNMDGEVISWAGKSYRYIMFAPVMQIFMTILMGFVYFTIGKAKQQVDAQNPEKSIEQNRIFRYRWSAFIVFASMLLILMFGFLQYAVIFITNPIIIISVPMASAGIIVIGAIILSVTTGQGGSRLTVVNNKTGGLINRDDDKYWKLGVFYYNPDDPAIFLEKRFGVGWTNNWARPASWLMIIGLIALIIIISSLSSYLIK